MEEYSFPFPPYEIQTSLMKEIVQCIDERKLGILESPTGTGKSMSLICATLTWLEKYEREEKIRCQKKLEEINEAGKEESDWVAAYRKKYNATIEANEAEETLENFKNLDMRLEKAKTRSSKGRKRKPFESVEVENIEIEPVLDDESNDEKDIILDENYISDTEYDKIDEVLKREKKPTCTKIIYASRTHTQLVQFAEEVMKTRFRPRLITLGSRQTLCVNESVRSLKNSNLITEKCNELRDKKCNKRRKNADEKDFDRSSTCQCPFARANAIEELSNQILNLELTSVDQLNRSGQRSTACPYFATREALSCCQLILVPYQILLNEDTRKAWGVDLKDNVVIIDEAHNLLETICNSHSTVLSLGGMWKASDVLSRYIELYRTRLKSVHLKHLRQLQSLLNNWMRLLTYYVSKKIDCVQNSKTFSAQVNLAQFDLFKMLDYIERSHLFLKLSKFVERKLSDVGLVSIKESKPQLSGIERLLQKKQEKNTNGQHYKSTSSTDIGSNVKSVTVDTTAPSSSSFFSIKQFLNLLTLGYDDSRIVVEGSKIDDEARFKFHLINPVARLKMLIDEPRSLIMIGGTMEPSEQLIHSLVNVCKVKAENIIRKSYGHVITDQQLTALTLGCVNGYELMFTYERRNCDKTVQGLLKCFVDLTQVIPNGIIAFFPSYSYMEFIERKLNDDRSFQSFRQSKHIFFERRSSGVSTLFNDYAQKARSQSGALLCAVVGGKLSEGINFSDELGRGVIMVGLPYTNKNDLLLTEKIKFLDEKVAKGMGNLYYESNCMHSINQSIGRVIRHRNDYAVIILLDRRYRHKNILKGLPLWIQTRVKEVNDLRSGVIEVQHFFSKLNSERLKIKL